MKQLTPEQLAWCEQNLAKWEINDEGLIDVYKPVILSGENFQKLPVHFGKATQSFDLSGCKELVTLEGAPHIVEGWFDCRSCKNLKSLEYIPKIVGTWFGCFGCETLPEWTHALANSQLKKELNWEEFLHAYEKLLQKPKLVQAKNLGLF